MFQTFIKLELQLGRIPVDLSWKIGTWLINFSLRKVSTPWFASLIAQCVGRCRNAAHFFVSGIRPDVRPAPWHGVELQVLKVKGCNRPGQVHTRERQGLSVGGSGCSVMLGGTEPRVATASFQEKLSILIFYKVSRFLNLGN